MSIRARLVVLVCAVLGGVGSVWGRDIIYIPAGFPGVCAESLSTGEHYCPPGTTAQANAFCSEDLQYLRQWARSVGLDLCAGSAPTAAAINVDQVLLVDDRNMSSLLDGLLAPVARDLRVWEKSGPFRNREDLVRNVWIVGEASGAVSASATGAGSGGGETPVSTDEPGTGNRQSPATVAPDGGQTGDDLSGTDDQQASGDDSDEPRPGDHEPASGRCVPGQPFEYFSEQKQLHIQFSDDEAQFWFRVAQALYPSMVRTRANEFVHTQASEQANLHSQIQRSGALTGDAITVDVNINRRRCDRRVENVDIYNYDVFYSGTPTTGEGQEPDDRRQASAGDAAEPQSRGGNSSAGRCVPGQPFEPLRERRTHHIEFSDFEAQFWSRIGQALTLDMPWDVADDFVIKAAFGAWRDQHASMRDQGVQAGQHVEVSVLYSLRPCDRHVEYVSFLGFGWGES
jgi:hypothetical protein